MSTANPIEVEGAELAWSSDGQGPAILLIHAGVADQRKRPDEVAGVP